MTSGDAALYRGADADGYATACAFLRDLRSRVAERVELVPLGTALWHDGLPRIGDLNGLTLHGPRERDPDAKRLRSACDALHGGLAARQLIVEDEALLAALAPDMRAAGWKPSRFAVMVRRQPPTRKPIGVAAAHVVEGGGAQVRALEREIEYADPAVSQDAGLAELVEQLLDYNDARRALADGRCFVADDASACTLFSDGRVAQVESVVTLPHARGCGLASAVVLAACEAAAAAGHALTFIVAEADEWPRELYARLGFAAVGTFGTFSPAA